MPEELFKNDFAEVYVDSGKVYAKFPKSPHLSGKLKRYCGAKWSPQEKAWVCDEKHKDYVEELVRRYFEDAEEKIVLSCGGVPYVNGLDVVDYSRDGEWFRKPYTGVIKRYGSHGSRNYPRFEGFVVFKAPVGTNTEIEIRPSGRYEVFADIPEVYEKLEELVGTATCDEPEKEFEEIVSEVKQLENRHETHIRDVIVVEGFLVASQLPSPAILQQRFKELFKKTVVGKKEINLVTGYFINKLKRLAAKFYTEILDRHAIKIEAIGGGVYLVPLHSVTAFWHDVDELKKEYRKYERQLQDFFYYGKPPKGVRSTAKVDPKYLEVLEQYLKKHGVSLEEIDIPPIADRVKVSLVPLRISPELFENYVEEQAKRYKQTKLEEIAEEVRRTREEMISAVEQDLEQKLEEIMNKLSKAAKEKVTKKKLAHLRKAISEVETLAANTGLSAKHSARIKAMRNMIDALAEGKEEEIAEVDASLAKGRVKALLEMAL